MPERQYEFRVLGRLSQTTRQAFVDMDLTEVPAETIISTTLVDDDEIHAILTLIQSLGLNVISVERVSSSGGMRAHLDRCRSPDRAAAHGGQGGWPSPQPWRRDRWSRLSTPQLKT